MSEAHDTYATGWYCHNHNAGFEPQEARKNDDSCPWCGEGIDVRSD